VIVIPAIDLKDGRCVRLRQGRMDDVTVFSDDPLAMARHWLDHGCRRLHLVDLDGAVAGVPRNAATIRQIATLARDVPVQVGGGVRDLTTLEAYLKAGVAAVIVGTQAIEEPPFLTSACGHFPGRVMLGLDARGERIATRGWASESRRTVAEFAEWASSLPLAGIVYTDIERDGMGSGVNVAATVALAERVTVPVIASGGVGTLGDLERLADAALTCRGDLFGVITGRALYEGTLDLVAAQQLLDARFKAQTTVPRV
jgi:phosphoribosylformimino-5-aminoimidazole carboxamide ribotide isomerase